MTTVSFIKKDSMLSGIDISGHSGYARPGKDIICSAITTLSDVIATYLTKISDVPPKIIIENSKEEPRIFIGVTSQDPTVITLADQFLQSVKESLSDSMSQYDKYIQIL